jgi:hypothetical protein
MARATPPSPRTKVRRRAGRGRYARSTINAILDEGLVGHAAFVADGQPYGIPTLYARDGDVLYLHGSPLSRLLSSLSEGIPMCFTVTLVDGLVLARSAFHHSVNYRSVVVLGRGRAISDARGPSDLELKVTEVVVLPLDEASAKVRTGPPIDAPEDYARPVWAGEVPLRVVAGEPLADERCSQPVPDYVTRYHRGHA